MKNTFYISSKAAKKYNALIYLYFALFVALFIASLIDTDRISSFISFIFLLIGLSAYNTFKKSGIFDKIQITDSGIKVLGISQKQELFIPWENIREIQVLSEGYNQTYRIKSDVLLNEKPCILYVDRQHKIAQLLKEYSSISIDY